ncbi:hypothetical protein 7S3_57 [uncultured Caudovirales phage]|uniref:Uncharacterized protein n=1 Tax=uncultured Caudovirales phage TaxID=2100421 RepID=A0A2H4J2B9_9CAUD|nr:hypothetical protein 7S3_57 [uncultured Caudovirales phage]
MSTAEQIIAEALGDKIMHTNGSGDRNRAYAAHVVAALTNAGKTIVELPEADEWGMFGPLRVLSSGFIADEADDGEYSPTVARLIGARFLAAARVAEGGEHGE